MSTILVTGGAGYVGSHACKLLWKEGFRPVVLDNLSTGRREAVQWGPLEVGDILDPGRLHEVVARHRPIAVMHFAALALVGESTTEPARYWRTNLTGTINVLDACRAHAIDIFILSSTCAVYGVPGERGLTENVTPAPVNPYGSSKLAAERATCEYGASYGLRSAILRYFNAAGADPETETGELRAHETHLIPLCLDAILGRRPPLTIFGSDYPTSDGTAVRDYIHVADLAEGHVAALRHLANNGQSFVANLGAGRGFSVHEIIATIERVTGHSVPCERGPRRPGDPPYLVANPAFARELLKLDFPLSQSLDAIIETAWRWHLKSEQNRSSAKCPPARRNPEELVSAVAQGSRHR